jgi:hypothetical protein
MLKRVTHLTALSLLFLPTYACSSGGDNDQFTFGSSYTGQTSYTTNGMEEEGTGDTTGDGDPGDGDGDTGPGDGDGDTGPGDGDGDGDTGPGDGDGDGDTNCPPGAFGCPCDNGQCDPGLACEMGECALPSGDGDGDTGTTGDGDGDPWDPATCAMPSVEVSITDLEGSLCSAPCTVDADCPAGPVGTNPACALIFDGDVDPSQCALICDPLNDACSPGSSCKAIPDQPDVGICTYP